MRYRLFIYGTEARTADAIAVDLINRALLSNDVTEWMKNGAEEFMSVFDAQGIADRLCSCYGDKCAVFVNHSPTPKSIPYICLSTSGKHAAEVIAFAVCVAAVNDLALWDAEKDVTHYRTIVDEPFIRCREREKQIKTAILRSDLTVFRTKSTGEFYDVHECYNRSFTVTVRKSRKRGTLSVTDVTQRFHELLAGLVEDGERLCCHDRGFEIQGDRYSIRLCLEWGFKDRANLVGYYENGEPKYELLHRMSTEAAFKELAAFSKYEREIVFDRMRFYELLLDYPEPADRFVRSVVITKFLKQQRLELSYCGLDWRSSPNTVFHIVTDEWIPEEKSAFSCLMIGWSGESFIRPIVDEIYPLAKGKFYDEFHLPLDVWERIIIRLKEVKKLILHNTYSAELAPYIEQFHVSVFDENNASAGGSKKSDADILYEHRYEVARFYDFICDWLDSQKEKYGYSGNSRMMSYSAEY